MSRRRQAMMAAAAAALLAGAPPTPVDPEGPRLGEGPTRPPTRRELVEAAKEADAERERARRARRAARASRTKGGRA